MRFNRLGQRLAILSLALVALAVTTPSSQAQTYGTNAVALTATTQSIAGSSATNFNTVIDITKEKDLSIALWFAGDAAGTANVTAFFSPALDNSTNFMDNTKGFSLVGAATVSGGKVLVTTNLVRDSIGGYGYLILRYITNAAAAGNVTNVSVTVGLKKNAM